MKEIITTYLFITLSINSLQAQNNFEPNNDYTTAATLDCGNLYESFIQELGDQDWFKVQINESSYLSVDVNSVPANVDLHLAIFTIQNNEPKRIADDDDTNASGGESLRATAYLTAGTYYIYVTDENNNAFNNSESYNLIVSCLASSLEVNQTFELAIDIPQDTCFEERIWGENELFFNSNDGDNDKEWFKVKIDESGYLNVDITSVPTNLDLNLGIYVIENNQPKKIADDDDTNAGGGQSLRATAFISPGMYYIHINDESNNGTNEETYNLCLSFHSSSLEVNQTFELAIDISQDTCFEERIWGENELFFNSNDGDNDKEWFKVEIDKSGYLNVDITSVPTNLDLNLGIYIIENNQPKKIADDDDTNAGGGQNLRATAFITSGTYYIHINDENNDLTNEETYNFCIFFESSQLEVNQTFETAILIPQDTCFEERIWGENELFFNSNNGDNDREWLKVEIDESGYLSADITSVPTNLDLNLGIYIIENNQPKRIADDDDTNAGGGQSLRATAFISSGIYYIHINDENNDATNQETYNFCLSFFPNSLEVNQTFELAATIPQDTCFEERIWGENELFFNSNAGDNDREWYKVEIDKKCLLKASVTSVPTNLDLNLIIAQIINGQANTLSDDGDTNSSGGQSLFAELNVEEGTYYLYVEDEGNNTTNSETFTFCVSCEEMVGIDNTSLNTEIAIHPNPTTNSFNINFGELQQEVNSLEVLDIHGKSVLSQKLDKHSPNASIDISSVAEGLYFVSVILENGERFHTKVMKR